MKINMISPQNYLNRYAEYAPPKTSFALYQTPMYGVSFKRSETSEEERPQQTLIQKAGKAVKRKLKKTAKDFYSFLRAKTLKDGQNTVVKEKRVASKQAPGELLPQPVFSMDYDRVLDDLNRLEKIDEKWVKSNIPVLTAHFGYKPEKKHNEAIIKAAVDALNDNREPWIKDIEKTLAQEKAEYIKSIWDEFIFVNPPFKPVDKQKNLLGLKALQKYGSLDDLRNLPSDYKLSEDSDIMKEYAKFVARVGETKDTITLSAKLDRRYLKIYSQEALAEVFKALEKIMVHDAPPNHWANYDVMKFKDFEYCSKLDNSVISQAAKNIMDRIILDNPWMQ